MRRSILLLGLTGSVAVLGCGDDAGETALAEARLLPLSSCTDVVAAARAKALADMNARLDAALTRALDASGGIGGCGERGGLATGSAPGASVPQPAAPPGSPTTGDTSGASSYSTTNNQVAGVDEADFVKNDGKYIYVVTDTELRIIEAWPAEAARTISRTVVEGEARKLYVTDNRAVVYSSLPADGSANRTGNGYPRPGGSKECTYGYDCQFTGDGRPTKITIFDLADRSTPVLMREMVVSGSYVSARRVGNAIFTVFAQQEDPFPGVMDWPNDLAFCGTTTPSPEAIAQAFENLRERNREIIDATPVSSFLPTIEDITHRPDGTRAIRDDVLVDCPRFYRENVGRGDAFTTVLAFDIAKDESFDSATVYSRPGAVYASATALYFSVPHQRQAGLGWYQELVELEQLSTVHKFGLSTGQNPGVRYAGSGLVKGRVLNQFAMDEHRGDLRIATTSGRVPDPNVHSTLTVLADAEGTLEMVGQVDDLAPGEDIRSVRFDGDRGYVVTFKKTDPLFVFDLSNPRAPRVEAELKIPGFSTYMHRMDENHLLTIGYDAADQGNFAYFTGVLLQIFDVSNPREPMLAHKVIIGSRGSSSEALTNHLAFNYYPPKDLLLLPMTICELPPGSNNLFGARPTFSGLLAYAVTAEAGFSERGRVAHPSTDQRINCGNWWTDASSQVRRTIVMEDFVFSISGSQIKINHLADLPRDVATLSLHD